LLPANAEISYRNLSAVEQFEKIDAPQERGFTAAGRTHNYCQTAARKFNSKVFEKSVGAERFR
jgi:hypothetical protein